MWELSGEWIVAGEAALSWMNGGSEGGVVMGFVWGRSGETWSGRVRPVKDRDRKQARRDGAEHHGAEGLE